MGRSQALTHTFVATLLAIAALSCALFSPQYAHAADQPKPTTSSSFWTPYLDAEYTGYLDDYDVVAEAKTAARDAASVEQAGSTLRSMSVQASSATGERLAKERLVEAILEKRESAEFEFEEGVTVRECRIALAKLMSNPAFCHISGMTAYSRYVTSDDEDSCIAAEIFIGYASGSDGASSAAMSSAIKTALSWTTPDMTDVQKAQAVHDYLTRNVAYDYENYLADSIPDDSHTAYGALVKGVSVCDGYAAAYRLLLGYLGIECHVISGTVQDEGHAWNVVCLDGTYYNVDVTWDDPVPDHGFDYINHQYFLISDAELSANHEWESQYCAPQSYSDRDFPIYNASKGTQYYLLSEASGASLASQTYTGGAITPSPSLSLGSRQLKGDVDFTVSYEDNVDAGTALVTCVGKGYYLGAYATTFKIKKRQVSPKVSLKTSAVAFTGKKVTCGIKSVTVDGQALGKSSYTVKYSNNKSIGKSAKVTVTLTDNNLSGSVTKTFTIRPKSPTGVKLASRSKGFYLKWTKPATANATGCEIRYSTKSSMASAKKVRISSAKTTNKTVGKLKAKKRYYVQVRFYKTVGGKKVYSAWSKTKSVVTRR